MIGPGGQMDDVIQVSGSRLLVGAQNYINELLEDHVCTKWASLTSECGSASLCSPVCSRTVTWGADYTVPAVSYQWAPPRSHTAFGCQNNGAEALMSIQHHRSSRARSNAQLMRWLSLAAATTWIIMWILPSYRHTPNRYAMTKNFICFTIPYLHFLQATVAACDRVLATEGHGKGHGAQALPGGETKERGKTPHWDRDAMEDQILWKKSKARSSTHSQIY